jgi:Holliday junction resolvasome RuvABC endonuclease subunit
MRILGIDPSSTTCGVAVVDIPGEILDVGHWNRNKRESHPTGFVDWFRWLESYIALWQPQMAAIEMLGVERNANTARAVAFYQSISACCCKLHGLVVVEVRTSSARSIVLGNGGLSKDDAWEIMRKKHPNLFSPKKQGGEDEMDALVIAVAGPTAAER